MKGFGQDSKPKKKLKRNIHKRPSKEQIINQAINFHIQGNIPEAIKYYQYCINQGLVDHRVFSNYGVILQSNSKLQEAELSYRKAIELKPDYAEAHSNLGIILKDLGKFEEAEKSYRKAIELNPDFADAHSNLGLILKDFGKLKEAEKSTRKAIELNPDFLEAHSNLGSILRALGKLEDARICSKKVMSMRSWSILGSLSFNQMELD